MCHWSPSYIAFHTWSPPRHTSKVWYPMSSNNKPTQALWCLWVVVIFHEHHRHATHNNDVSWSVEQSFFTIWTCWHIHYWLLSSGCSPSSTCHLCQHHAATIITFTSSFVGSHQIHYGHHQIFLDQSLPFSTANSSWHMLLSPYFLVPPYAFHRTLLSN